MPQRHHHRHVPDDTWNPSHEVYGHVAGLHQAVPGLPATGRLLLHEPVQDRLPVPTSPRDVGRGKRQSRPLAESSGQGPAVLRRVQFHRLPRKRDRQDREVPVGDEDPGTQTATGRRPADHPAALLPRHAHCPRGLEAELRIDHGHGRLGRQTDLATEERRAVREHDHLLLVRPRHRPAACQAVAL